MCTSSTAGTKEFLVWVKSTVLHPTQNPCIPSPLLLDPMPPTPILGSHAPCPSSQNCVSLPSSPLPNSLAGFTWDTTLLSALGKLCRMEVGACGSLWSRERGTDEKAANCMPPVLDRELVFLFCIILQMFVFNIRKHALKKAFKETLSVLPGQGR